MTEQSKGWRAGDLAVCIASEGWWDEADWSASIGPENEQVVRVAIVHDEVAFEAGPGIGLEFSEFPDEIYSAEHFRRIEPDHTAADDAEFIALIDSIRAPATVGAPSSYVPAPPPHGRNGAAASAPPAAAPPLSPSGGEAR